MKQMLDLGPFDCRWPLKGAGAETFFCAAPTLKSPYCPSHLLRAYRFSCSKQSSNQSGTQSPARPAQSVGSDAMRLSAPQIAMQLARELTSATRPQIRLCNQRDHATVLDACGTIVRRMAENAMLCEEISFMRAALNSVPESSLEPPPISAGLINSGGLSTAPASLTPYCDHVPVELTDPKSTQ